MTRIFMPAVLSCGLILIVFVGPSPSDGSTEERVAPAARTELADRVAAFIDTNHDGKISEAEARDGREAAAWILGRSLSACDADADGTVTREEYVATLKTEPGRGTTVEQEVEAAGPEVQTGETSVPLGVVLSQLAGQEYFREEVALLHAELDDLDDRDYVVAYLAQHPARYARLRPFVTKWVEKHPKKPGYRRGSNREPDRSRAATLRNRAQHGRRQGPAADGARPKLQPHGRKPRPAAGGKPRPPRR